jgi:hypothetical protein
MPNKTIYVKDSDIPLWERVQTELGSSVSSFFIECLKSRLEEQSRTIGAMRKITVEVLNERRDKVKKSFVGRWLAEDLEPVNASDGVSRSANISVAQSAKGKIVACEDLGDGFKSLDIYDSFDDFKAATIDGGYPAYPQNVLAAVADALNVPYEVELDI